jgi:hypothetical protein
MRLNLVTVAGFFLLFVGTVEIGYGGFVSSVAFFGTVGGPGLWGILFGIALVTIGSGRKRFSKQT